MSPLRNSRAFAGGAEAVGRTAFDFHRRRRCDEAGRADRSWAQVSSVRRRPSRELATEGGLIWHRERRQVEGVDSAGGEVRWEAAGEVRFGWRRAFSGPEIRMQMRGIAYIDQVDVLIRQHVA